ncbi:MAG: hypothetical protein ABJB11_14525 [Ferruginibacter sp.]
MKQKHILIALALLIYCCAVSAQKKIMKTTTPGKHTTIKYSKEDSLPGPVSSKLPAGYKAKRKL